MTKLVLIIVFILSLIPKLCEANSEIVNRIWSENGVNICAAKNEQAMQKAISDGKGGAIIVWEDDRARMEEITGGDLVIPEPRPKLYIYKDIYVQKITSEGVVSWKKDGVPVCTEKNLQTSPEIIPDDKGGAIIVWADTRNSGGGDFYSLNYDIYVQKIDENGNLKWIENGVEICTAKESQISFKVVSDGSGGAIIAWADYRAEGKSNTDVNCSIYAQRIDADGNLKWQKDGILICTARYGLVPYIISDNNGGTIIIWLDNRKKYLYFYNILAQKIDSDGMVKWQKDGVPVCTANSDETSIAVIPDNTGGAIVVWEDYRFKRKDIYAQRIDDNGNVVWKEDRKITRYLFVERSFKAVSNGIKGAFIGWTDNTSGGHTEIYIQNINEYGRGIYGEGGIMHGTGILRNEASSLMDIIPSDKGCAIILGWGKVYNIYAEKISSEYQMGKFLLWKGEIFKNTSGYQYTSLFVMSDGFGGLIVIWNAGGDIYAQRYNVK